MANKENAPTFEEYKALVKSQLAKSLSQLSEYELESYLASELSRLNEWYRRSIEEYENGEIVLSALSDGCPASAAYALDLMYE